MEDGEALKSQADSVSKSGWGWTRWMVTVGPGIVYGLSVLGAGDIVSNSAAGASYQYSLIWSLWMALIFRYVWVNVSAKYVLVTGESLLEGYGRVGLWVPLLVLLAFLPARHLTNQYLMLMMGSLLRSRCLGQVPSPCPSMGSGGEHSCSFMGTHVPVYWPRRRP